MSSNKPAELSQEEKDKLWAGLPDMFKASVTDLSEKINKHNADVEIVRTASQEKKSETDTIFELIEKGEYKDKALLNLKGKIDETLELLETLKLQALARANEIKLKPVDVSLDDANAANERAKVSSAALRPLIAALETLTPLVGANLTIFLPKIDSTRGLRLGGPAGTTGKTTRPQYKSIFIVDDHGNKELIEKEVEKKRGGVIVKEMTSSTTILAQELSKRGGKDFSVNATEITEQFLKSQNVDDFAKLTAGVEMPWTFVKPVTDSEGKEIGNKEFKLVFVK